MLVALYYALKNRDIKNKFNVVLVKIFNIFHKSNEQKVALIFKEELFQSIGGINVK